MRKTEVLLIEPFYLGLSILDLRKTVMYELWYDSVKLKYGENAKICFMDTGYGYMDNIWIQNLLYG